MLGAYRARAVPFNVNQHYRPAEVGALLADLGVRAVVYHRALRPARRRRLRRRGPRAGRRRRRLGRRAAAGQHAVRGGGRPRRVDGRCPTPSPDDLYLVCTGGTTGRPKAVLWRQADIYVVGHGRQPRAPPPSRSPSGAAGAGGAVVRRAAAHARRRPVDRVLRAAQRAPPCVLHDDSQPLRRRGGSSELAERERVFLMSIVGDAYARPLVEELRRRPLRPGVAARASAPAARRPASTTRRRCSSCSPTSRSWTATARRRPAAWRSAPAAGPAGRRASRPAPGPRWSPPTATRFLEPGRRRGRLDGPPGPGAARLPRRPGEDRGDVPDRRRRAGGDPRRPRPACSPTAASGCSGATRWWSTPAARRCSSRRSRRCSRRTPTSPTPSWSAGRRSASGRRWSRWWRRATGATLDPAELREFVAAEIARFKAPRAVAVCDAVRRHANGKADYRVGQEVAPVAAVDVDGGAADGPRRPRPRLPASSAGRPAWAGPRPRRWPPTARGWRSPAGAGRGPRRPPAELPAATGATVVAPGRRPDRAGRRRGPGGRGRRAAGRPAGHGRHHRARDARPARPARPAPTRTGRRRSTTCCWPRSGPAGPPCPCWSTAAGERS